MLFYSTLVDAQAQKSPAVSSEEKISTPSDFEQTMNFNKTVAVNVGGMDLTLMPANEVQQQQECSDSEVSFFGAASDPSSSQPEETTKQTVKDEENLIPEATSDVVEVNKLEEKTHAPDFGDEVDCGATSLQRELQKQDKDLSLLNLDSSMDNLVKSDILIDDNDGDAMSDMEITGRVEYNKTKNAGECMEMDKYVKISFIFLQCYQNN